MQRIRKTAVATLSVVLAVSFLAGCSNDTKKGMKDLPVQTTQKQETETLPIVKQPLKIRWLATNYQSTVVQSFDDIECFKEIKKRTGIQIEWMHDTLNTDKINLMVASNDLPDLIWNNWGANLRKFYEEGTAIKLNELIDQYVPSLKKPMEKNPDVRKQIMLDDGSIAMFPEYNPDPPGSPSRELGTSRGFQVRKDWLKSANVKEPVTIDDWYTMLKAFRDRDLNGNGKADEIPFVDEKGNNIKTFSAAWGVRDTFHPDAKTGKVIFGTIEPAFKDFLTTMNKWYREGLIDPEIFTTDRKGLDAKILENRAGSYYGYMYSQMEVYFKSIKDKNSTFDLMGVASPTGPAGKPYDVLDANIRNVSAYGAILTKNCKYPVEVAKLMNYMYGEEGSTLQNWGIEGKSYVVENGKKKLTDAIMKDPEGKTPQVAILKYAYNANGFARTPDFELAEQLNSGYTKKGADDPRLIWGKTDKSILLPPVSLTQEEQQKQSEIMGQVNSFKNGMITKFITGEESLDKFDDFVKTIKKMGIDDVIKISQDALDRFKARK